MALTDSPWEFGQVLSSAARKTLKPALLVPLLTVVIVPQVLMLGLVARMAALLRYATRPELLGWAEAWSGPVMFFMIVLLASLPAIVSGFACLAAVSAETSGWRDGFRVLWKGLGKYYWRIVGAYALLMAGVIVVAMVFIPAAIATAARGTTTTIQDMLTWALGVAGGYVFSPWLAVAVVDGTGSWASIKRGAAFAWKHPGLLIPASVVGSVGVWVGQRVSNLGWSDPAALESFSVYPGWWLAAALSGALTGFILLLVLVVRIDAYRLKAGTP